MLKKISRRQLGILISLAIILAATGISYVSIEKLYDQTEDEGGTKIDNARYSADTEEKPAGGAALSSESAKGASRSSQDPFEKNIPFVSLGIGISMGIVSLIMWEGSKRTGGDAISMLIHRGLEDLTVRDLNITRQMIVKGEFTIPELLNHTSASRQSVWRLVNKLTEEGLVKKTDEKRLPKSGRGKPSQVYRYVGPDLSG